MGNRALPACAVAVLLLAAPLTSASTANADITKADLGDASLRTSVQTDATGGFIGGSAECNQSERLLTGGAYFQPSAGGGSAADADNAYLAGSAPLSSDRWYAEGIHRFAQYSIDLVEYAFCLPKQRLQGVTTKEKTVDASDFSRAQGTAHCPNGTRVISGGAYFHEQGSGPDPAGGGDSRFSASFPEPNGSGWYASGKSGYDNKGRLTIHARCLDESRLGSIETEKAKQTTLDVNVGGYTFCPGTRAALTGGAYWLRPGRSVKDSPEAGAISSATLGTFPDGFYATGQPKSGVSRQFVTIIHCIGN